MSTTAIEEQPTKILTELRGQSIILPDLNAILGSWPREVHQDLGRLRCDVNEWLDRYDILKPPRPPPKVLFFSLFSIRNVTCIAR